MAPASFDSRRRLSIVPGQGMFCAAVVTAWSQKIVTIVRWSPLAGDERSDQVGGGFIVARHDVRVGAQCHADVGVAESLR